jgi:toluene monooxygenase system ferredoxin subunit
MRAFATEVGLKVLIANAGDRYYANQAMCPHMDVPLEDGFYDGSVITCHQHLWQWDVRTGAPLGQAQAPLERYELHEEGGALYLAPPSPLKQAGLFSGLEDHTLEAILRLARPQTFDEGSVIYRPGDLADNLCVLESGRVQFAIGHEGRARPAGFSLQSGEVFGWNALLEDQPSRIATATCLEKSTVVLISGRELSRIFERDPAAGYVVMRRLAALITGHLTPTGAR